MDCLRHRLFARQCQLSQRCKKCSGTHHTLLHRDTSKNKSEHEAAPKSAKVDHSKTPAEKVTSNFSNGKRGSVLLMTCQVIVRGPNGSTAQARALLDLGSEACFIMERLA